MRTLVSASLFRELCNLLGQPWLALTRMKHGTGALLVNRCAECFFLHFTTQRAAHSRSVGRCCLQRNSRRAPAGLDFRQLHCRQATALQCSGSVYMMLFVHR